ncbi:alpha/beta hydrolase [Ktedonosporobacter rubrisoli]|uniref:Alpha/beta hydrolase n=1 Tax=Ktedonosporobacter rubrisoli TaxID=2509675 RepID=A0A4P6JMX8_KTERU|nr:alpha/beta hydrolase [Ktedonosporobacter rubrisoli]QBD76392.1 alpha/beta hydrolase [Ktedonosporobacter rubrisoli]
MECIAHDVPVYYEAYGEGQPIILLHGFNCDHRMMTNSMEQPIFARRTGWRRIYLDLPGMGQTPGKEHIRGSDDMLDVVIDFIDTLIPGQRFLLVGESYGGYLARGVLQRKFEQVDGMALICPGIIANPTRRDVSPQSIIVRNPALLASLEEEDADEFASMAVVQDRYNWERFRDELLTPSRIADEAFLKKFREQYDYTFEVDRLPEPFTKPVVMLLGRQDHIVGYRDAWRILENYPRATFAVLDRAGHNAHIEQPELFNALISEWLERVGEARQAAAHI